jgi:hypothetical protein
MDVLKNCIAQHFISPWKRKKKKTENERKRG